MPLPLPEPPPVTVIKLELFVTLQVQPAEVMTLKLPAPALELRFELFVLKEYAHVGAVRVSEKCSELLPNVAVISAVVFVVTLEELTVKFLLSEPLLMLIDAGTVAADALLDKPTVVVLAAELLKVAVHVDDVGGVTLAGLQLKAESTGAAGWLIVTAALPSVMLRGLALASDASELIIETGVDVSVVPAAI